jgi:hypothetical protein
MAGPLGKVVAQAAKNAWIARTMRRSGQNLKARRRVRAALRRAQAGPQEWSFKTAATATR